MEGLLLFFGLFENVFSLWFFVKNVCFLIILVLDIFVLSNFCFSL